MSHERAHRTWVSPCRAARLGLAVVILCALSPAIARAERPALALLDLRFSDAAAALRRGVREQLRQTFRQLGYRVRSGRQVHDKLSEASVAPGCTTGPCLAEVGRALGVAYAITGGVAGHGSSYDITFTLLDAAGGGVLAQVNGRCDVCTFKDVSKRVRAMARKLQHEARSFAASHGRLVVRTEPKGATVELDSVRIGTSPLRRMVLPGSHQIVLRHRGYAEHRERFRAVPGKTELVSLQLARGDGASPPPVRARGPLRWVKWTTLGVGLGAMAAGAVLLGLDGGCKNDSCTERRDLVVPGAVVLGSGAALTLLSGLLFWWDEQSPTTHARSVSLSTEGGHGLSVRYAQRF